MRKPLAGLLALFAVGLASAAEVAGVRLEDRLKVGTTELVLNGAGIRTKLFFKVYVGALYVVQPTHEANAVINAAAPRRMVLRMMRDLGADKLSEAMHDGLKANLAEPELAALTAPLGRLDAVFKAVGQVREGDVLALDFDNAGLSITLNSESRGRIESDPLGRALLRVWLGDHPVDAGLKKGLLGQQ